jgi:hypothetical protein
LDVNIRLHAHHHSLDHIRHSPVHSLLQYLQAQLDLLVQLEPLAHLELAL